MPIRIVFEDGQYRPTFFCDRCSQPIVNENGKDGLGGGNYLFIVHPTGRYPIIDTVYVLHKGCTFPFIASVSIPPEACAIEELDVLPIYLLANLRVSLKKAVEHARLLASL